MESVKIVEKTELRSREERKTKKRKREWKEGMKNRTQRKTEISIKMLKKKMTTVL